MKRYLYLLLAVLFVSVSSFSQVNITGFFQKNTEKQLKLESSFDEQLDAVRIGNHIKTLSEKPHHLNSLAGKENADYLLNQFKSFGWDAKIETFYVLFPSPRVRTLELIAPYNYRAVLKEAVIKEDPSTAAPGALPPYNAYGADGDVTAELVFVNYGIPDDYKMLEKMGIDVKGKIVIAKYGRSWRGTKPKVAQEHGAVGCIIYSDPADDGYMAGDVYPKGSYKNGTAVQRGSVMDIVIHPGDPLTPGIGAWKDAERISRETAETILKIPVLPIGYDDAAPLLKALDGRNVPREWQGGLPFAYHTGPGVAKVRLKIAHNWDVVPCYNVIATLKGSAFPDEWIIRGNHHDAWVHGAADPISGLSAMLEEARAIGRLAESGWQPKRTLVYCAWDGEEEGLLGSTEWVEAHQDELRKKAVVYINSDNNGRGFLYAEGSHALTPLMTEIAKAVVDPQTGISIFDRRNAANALRTSSPSQKEKTINSKELKLGAMGSGSDYSAFIQHLGIPALSLGFGGEDRGGEYHTLYDTYENFIRFKDSGFVYARTLSQTAGRAVLRMANSDVLPFKLNYTTATIDDYKNELQQLLDDKHKQSEVENLMVQEGIYQTGNDPRENFVSPSVTSAVPYLNFSPLENALVKLKRATDSLNTVYSKQISEASVDEQFNRKLYASEQQLLGPGLPLRPWYKHIIYAPGYYTGYGVKTMPGIREAIEEEKWTEAQEQIEVASKVLSDFADYLNR